MTNQIKNKIASLICQSDDCKIIAVLGKFVLFRKSLHVQGSFIIINNRFWRVIKPRADKFSNKGGVLWPKREKRMYVICAVKRCSLQNLVLEH